jgi:hypothetical protein
MIINNFLFKTGTIEINAQGAHLLRGRKVIQTPFERDSHDDALKMRCVTPLLVGLCWARTSKTLGSEFTRKL